MLAVKGGHLLVSARSAVEEVNNFSTVKREMSRWSRGLVLNYVFFCESYYLEVGQNNRSTNDKRRSQIYLSPRFLFMYGLIWQQHLRLQTVCPNAPQVNHIVKSRQIYYD